MEGSKVGLLEAGRAQEGASRVGEAGWSLANTGKNSRKYPACQLLYWYRSNELWKSGRNSCWLGTARLADRSLVVRLKDVQKVFGVTGDIPGPCAEAAVVVDGLRPFREEFALGFVLLGVLPFDFEDEHLS